MSGFWKKGYYILCFIVRTLYYNVFDEKINTKYLVKYLERML